MKAIRKTGTVKALRILLFSASVLLLAWGTASGTISTVANSTSDQATALGHQRKLFRDTDGYFWAFYFNGTNTYFQRSSDTTGVNWQEPAQLLYAGQVQPSVWLDTDTVCVAFSSNFDVLVRRGVINSGAITWSATFTVMDGTTSAPYSVAALCKDKNGFLWVAARVRSGGTYYGCVARSSSPWSVGSWLAPQTITSGSATGYVYPLIVPLAGGDAYAVWSRDGQIEGKRYVSGTGWQSTATFIASGVTGDAQSLPSALGDGTGNAHLFYVSQAGDARYKRYDGGLWGPDQILGGTGAASPTISINPSNQRLYAVWISGTTMLCRSAILPASAGDWRTEYSTSGRFEKSFLTSCYSSVSRITWLMTQGSQGSGPRYTVITDGLTVGTVSVLVSMSSFSFGVQPLDTWLSPQSCLLTNDGTCTEDLYGKLSQFVSGAYTWDVSAVSNGPNACRAQWSTVSATGPWNDISAYDSEFPIATGLAPGDNASLYFRIQTPTLTSSYNEYATGLTVRAQD